MIAVQLKRCFERPGDSKFPKLSRRDVAHTQMAPEDQVESESNHRGPAAAGESDQSQAVVEEAGAWGELEVAAVLGDVAGGDKGRSTAFSIRLPGGFGKVVLP